MTISTAAAPENADETAPETAPETAAQNAAPTAPTPPAVPQVSNDNANAATTTPEAPVADGRGNAIEWLIPPHLISRTIVAAGLTNHGAKVANVLDEESAAFNIYRINPAALLPNRYEPVAVIVPRRNDGRDWPAALPSGAQVITARQYSVSDGGFMFIADMGRLLPDEQQHVVTVAGTAPGNGSRVQALARHDLGRYHHQRLPHISLWTLLMRLLAALLALLAALRLLWKPALLLLAAVLLALAAIGAIVLIEPSWMGLAVLEQAERLYSWLPWR